MNYKRFAFAVLILLIIVTGVYFISDNNNNESTQINNENNNNVEVKQSEGSEFLMNTLVRVRIHDEKSEEILEGVLDRIRELENILSKTIENSDVYKINLNAGKEPVQVDKRTYELLEEALFFAEKTNGSFDPSINPIVSLWGIGTKDERVPSEEEIKNTIRKVNYNNLALMDDNNVYLENEDMSIDLGAIAKGYAADKIITYLSENDVESAFINMGGNVSVHRKKVDGSLWNIGIQDPDRTRGNIIAAVKGEDISVVTSGNYERYFTEAGVRYHHIIDPESGYPAKNGIISSTVISNDSSYADALSTSLYILGVEKAFELVKDMEDINIVLITEEDKAYVSKDLKDKITFTVDELDVIYK
ncbi:MAG: FAD:protein FMN transferase [Halanaerobiales bacterium]|nr:FAD:protein FMN transferase [Halanaerobiales bacterium]